MPGSMPRGAVLAGGGGGGAVGGGERGTGGRGPNAAMLDCPLPPGFGGERIEFSSTASRSSPAAVKGEKKVISKDMIGRPTQFVCVVRTHVTFYQGILQVERRADGPLTIYQARSSCVGCGPGPGDAHAIRCGGSRQDAWCVGLSLTLSAG